MSIDVAGLRAGLSALSSGIAHFDSPGGTQTPDAVADAIRDALVHPLSNRGRGNLAARNADDLVTGARAALGDLLGVAPGTVVVGRSMTALTFDLARTLSAEWAEGDEVVVTRLDHDANVRPWVIAAERRGVTVRFADFDPETSELPVEAIASLLTPRTRLVAVTAASNLLGTMPDVAGIAAAAREAGALVHVDAVHYAAHQLVDVAALGADLLSCSPYKFLGPHCGVLTGSADLLERLRPDKLIPSTDAVPERFELGTLPFELLAGVSAAVEVLATMAPGTGGRRERLAGSFAALGEHEARLRTRIEDTVADWSDVTVHSRAERRTPTLLLTFADRAAAEVADRLAALSVNAPAGHFYAWETVHHLGLGPAGGLRIGLAPYTDDADVDRLLSGLDAVLH